MSASVSIWRDPFGGHPHGGGNDRHVVQFYEDESFIVATVADFLGRGIHQGEPLVVIATAAHRQAFRERLASAGVDVLLLGVVPTPGVAYLTASLDADLGVMISASHNPMPDNGIKFLARGGVKLDDAIEVAIEERLREP